MLVNCQTEIASRGDRDIENLSFLLEQNPWLKSLSEKNKSFKDQIEKDTKTSTD